MTFWQEPEEPQLTIEQVRALATSQADILVATGTGGGSIDSYNTQYKKQARQLKRELARLGISASLAFPWTDLWLWHGFYGRELQTWAERRVHVREKLSELEDALDAIASGAGSPHDPGSTGETTWALLDGRVRGLVDEIANARERDDWQDVGRRAREILIDGAKLIADPALVPEGVDEPKAGDAKAWLGYFLDRYAAGSVHKELRALLRAAWDLAQKVTHGDIDRADAFAAAQSVILVVRVVQQLKADGDSSAPEAPGDQIW